MKTLLLDIDIFSYWHIGTGRGRGREADALTLKDKDGLPYLPGRALKGLLREAAQTAEEYEMFSDDKTVSQLFDMDYEGSHSADSQGQRLRFDSATLPSDVSQWFRAMGVDYINQLYRLIPATELDDAGLAQDKTLRLVEVCLPLRLTAAVQVETDSDSKILGDVLGLVRALGVRRRRGYGRCRITISDKRRDDNA